MKVSYKDQIDIIEAYDVGLETMIGLADKYGVTRQAIWNILKRNGINTKKRKLAVSCSCCGKEIMRHKQRLRTNKNHFCDQECYTAFLEAGNGNPYIFSRQGQRVGRAVVSNYFKLKEWFVVHHKDRNNMNNNPKNLMVFANNGDHVRHHRGFRVEPLWDGAVI